MPKNDYGELFCQAVDTIIKERLNEISFDQTIICTIVDDKEKANGKYKVSNGSAKFDAYSTDTTLSNNISVYVQIPGGDWSQDKIILCRKPIGDEKPISYKDPFNSFVDITGNLITQTPKQQGLVANNPDPNRIVIWAYNCNESPTTYKESGVDLAGYTRLGLKASFQTWLRELNTVKGSYGLRLRIEGTPEDEQGLSKDETEIETVFYDLVFDCGEMPGNPYNYESFYKQEKLFDISNIYKIRKMELEFYEKDGTFKDLLGADVPWQNEPPNVFVKDIYISLGYDSNSFDTDTLMIYSLDSSQYIATEDPPEDNHKKVEIRWIHKMDDGSFKSISMDDDINYDLNWYRKELGSRSDTVYSGVDWKPLSRQGVNKGSFTYPIIDNDWLEYNEIAADPANTGGLPRYPGFNYTWLIPDITRAEEQIKAILIYDDQVFYSNILSFTNRKEVVSKPTVDAIQALTINCEDNSHGNYLVYDLEGHLINSGIANDPKTFKAYFNSILDENSENIITSQLTEAEQIEWIIPTVNTMIDVEDYLSAESYKDANGYQHIFRYGEKNNKYNIVNENSQRYKIKPFYMQSYSNNTVKCVVTKDKTTYTAIKNLVFGPTGTSGTDYSFILKFEDGENALTLNTDFENGETIPAVFARARLFDYENNEIDISEKNIVWSWKNGDNNWIDLGMDANGFSVLNEKNKIELKLKDSNPILNDVPTDNYSILKATLKKSLQTDDGGWGDYDLCAYLPIPIRRSRRYAFIDGIERIVYNSLGYLDTHFQNPYQIHVVDTYDKLKQYVTTIPSTWQIGPKTILNSKNEEELNLYLPELQVDNAGYTYIRPINIYVEQAFDKICIVGSVKDENNNAIKVWSQPIYIYQNKYPSSIINNWNGELKIDKDNNAILAAKVVAGKKENDNTFSGVMMGDWGKVGKSESTEDAIETGLYGFKHGISTFGFNVDGTAYIGKPGKGRLEFDGEKSIITSNSMANNLGGVLIDFDEGYIQLLQPHDKETEASGNEILIDAREDASYPFKIGSKIDSNFMVDWNGIMHASGGYFDGTIEAATLKGANGKLKLQGYINVDEKLYIGDIAGGYFDEEGKWNPSKLVGMKIFDADGFTIEGEVVKKGEEGKKIRLGNQSNTDGIILQGGSINFITPSPENQHGIYARFA